MEKTKDHMRDDANDDEGEDIISLCDLPLNCNNKSQICQNQNHDQQRDSVTNKFHDQIASLTLSSSSHDENQENMFEFFSEEWNITNTSTTLSDNLAFVSTKADNHDQNNIFPRPKSISEPKTATVKPKSVNTIIQHPKRCNSSSKILRSKSDHSRFSKSKSYNLSTYTKTTDEDQSKVSGLASPVKSKLLYVLFGLPPKIPTGQTELMTDIRIRQSRHAPSTFLPSNHTGDHEAVPVTRRSDNRLWRVIKRVACFRWQQNENESFKGRNNTPQVHNSS